MAWKHFNSSTQRKSLKELKEEVDKLKESERNVKSYNELQSEKQRIMKEIRREGFKTKHKKALKIINETESIMKNIAQKSKPYAKKIYKELMK